VSEPQQPAESPVETEACPPEPDARRDSRRDRRKSLRCIVTFGVLPALTLLLALAAGFLKYQADSARDAQRSAASSVKAATDATIALLSYTPDTAQTKLSAARDLLTGTFRDSYTSLTNDVVIPGAQQKKISATAAVPAAASMSASAGHAVVLVFVDQTVVIGNDTPSATASAVQVTLEKAGNRWLISGFDPK
jgi:Mce-associated membrane protein